MTGTGPAREELMLPWRRAFDEAWTAWRAGSLGIGAVLVEPESGEILTTGRNRSGEPRTEPGVLAGNYIAHAEMNAIAVLERRKADGLHLYTTLEPCLMCAATTIFMHVDTVYFAAADPMIDGIGELWPQHPYSRRNNNTSIGPLHNLWATVSTLLVLTRTPRTIVSYDVIARASPLAAEMADAQDNDGLLDDLAANGAPVDAVFDLVVERSVRGGAS